MRKKRKHRFSAIATLSGGILFCVILALLQQDLHRTVDRLRNVDYVEIEKDGTVQMLVSDPNTIQQLVQFLKKSSQFYLNRNQEYTITDVLQVNLYSANSKCTVKLVKNFDYGYFILYNNSFYKSENFNSLIQRLSEQSGKKALVNKYYVK